jgi:hypothetical protein
MKVTMQKIEYSSAVVDVDQELLDELYGDCSMERYDEARAKVIKLAEEVGFKQYYFEYDTDV